MSLIMLWTAPRCGSTVFERSIRELSCVDVLYEPHQGPYYYGPDKVCSGNPYRDDGTPRVNSSFESTRKMILSLGNECLKEDNHHLLVKEMAYYLKGKYNDYIFGEFSGFKHTFLIRHPIAAGISWYRAVTATGEHYHNLQALGFADLYNMYEIVKSVDPNPLVIDAEDLFKYSRNIMELYCGATGLPFTENMLTWEPKVFPDWKDCSNYGVWHKNVISSCGFSMDTPRTSQMNVDDLPPEYKESIKHAMPLYEKLYSVRTFCSD